MTDQNEIARRRRSVDAELDFIKREQRIIDKIHQAAGWVMIPHTERFVEADYRRAKVRLKEAIHQIEEVLGEGEKSQGGHRVGVGGGEGDKGDVGEVGVGAKAAPAV